MLTCVTGATGFVGSHVVSALLQEGHSVRALYRSEDKLKILQSLPHEAIRGDVTDIESLRSAFAGCDWVFHVAAVADYWNADNQWMFEVNVQGTKHVLEAARDTGVKRVIFTSSVGAVGLPVDATPSDESQHFNLMPRQFPYGYSKVLAEEVVQEAVTQYGQDVVILNPAIIIGPGDMNEIGGSFITQVAQWQWLTPISGGGFSVIDVRDVAAAHVAAASRGRTGERYILTTLNVDDRTWFDMVADVLGVAPPVFKMPNFAVPILAAFAGALRRIGIPLPVDPDQIRLATRYIYFDGSKAAAEIHQPKIDMRRSLQDTFDWYQANGYVKTTPITRMVAMIGRLLK